MNSLQIGHDAAQCRPVEVGMKMAFSAGVREFSHKGGHPELAHRAERQFLVTPFRFSLKEHPVMLGKIIRTRLGTKLACKCLNYLFRIGQFFLKSYILLFDRLYL